jgi:hypothetical protein
MPLSKHHATPNRAKDVVIVFCLILVGSLGHNHAGGCRGTIPFRLSDGILFTPKLIATTTIQGPHAWKDLEKFGAVIAGGTLEGMIGRDKAGVLKNI